MLEQILGSHRQAVEFKRHSSYKTVTKNTVTMCKDRQNDVGISNRVICED